MAEEVYESDLINMVIGTHMSIAKGIVKTAENVVKMNADTMQIFSRNPRGSNYKDPKRRSFRGSGERPVLERFWRMHLIR